MNSLLLCKCMSLARSFDSEPLHPSSMSLPTCAGNCAVHRSHPEVKITGHNFGGVGPREAMKTSAKLSVGQSCEAVVRLSCRSALPVVHTLIDFRCSRIDACRISYFNEDPCTHRIRSLPSIENGILFAVSPHGYPGMRPRR